MNKCRIFFLGLILFLSACATPATAVTYQVAPSPLPGQSAADAQATLAAFQVQQQATRDYQVAVTAQAQQATAVAIQATEQAQAIATGTAQAQASAIEATSAALSFKATEQALEFGATREAGQLMATATAAAQENNLVATLQADEAERLHLQREAEAIAQDRARILNNWIPILIAGLIGVAAFLTIFIGYVQLTKNRPVTIHHDNRQITVLPDGAGGFRMLPVSRTPLALPAPGENDDEIIDGEFEPVLDVLNGEQAVLVHGAKGTGKTTLLLWLMAARPNALIVDPHGAPGKWPNCHMVGAGREFEAIGRTLQQIHDLMTSRYAEIGRGDVIEGNHEKLTLFIDEYRAIVQNVPTAKDVIATLLTEARKANIDIVLVSHSRNVKALGLEGEGDLREGFAFVHLEQVRGQRRAVVLFGMDEETAVPVALPGPFSPHVRPAYAHNNAARILDLIPVQSDNTLPADGIATEWGFVSRDDVVDILAKAAENVRQHGTEKRRQICVEKFNTGGGDAYLRMKYILDLAEDSGYYHDEIEARAAYIMG